MELESPEKKAMAVGGLAAGLRDLLTVGRSDAYRYERRGSMSGGWCRFVARATISEREMSSL